ncbi:hypothetical protein S7711_06548 [Stachybotrys chartarum IBT 7711]|uniref:Carrier domain-containing protein n=1 Tax=Stachybotrys chartarum (strain CBS 109288 / IBT 7711) TaxID=1280523 RepID=A0A084B2L7_STACB|nr:hypothetical protein S7711_06548 [Stachybotrys chartarum IBT 7711]
MSTPEPIALVGVGCRFPGNASSPSALWDLLRSPRDLLTPIPADRFSTRGFYHADGQYHGHANIKESYLLEGEGTHRRFDAQFFGISPAEARVMDPQVRILLETVYEALENAGHTIDGLQESDTAVYAGAMVYDYEHIMSRDEISMGTYHVTGTARSLISNRVSYFFNWHGPSMTIDTACSSSMYAVHHAVQQLRSGASRVAVATGSNLLLDPLGYVTESKMHMLSPESRSRMWDAEANGYARGEGVAAVVLKTLSAAEADGDFIHCIIRETGVNQDGRTKGITMPSAQAQAAMIRDCYTRAGLDVSNAADRPQYFEAHGTGTPAGDPVEAEAISTAFFNGKANPTLATPLYVGSIKTVIGHTEGTAGLAGLLKASLALQNSTIPPNLLFNRLSPRVKPFYTNLQVPTASIPWPDVAAGSPRRASVNSFGFGGANAHAILESYTPRSIVSSQPDTPAFSPLIFSAASENSLAAYIGEFCDYLSRERSFSLRDVASTLLSRRTRFPITASFSETTIDGLVSKINQRLDTIRSNSSEQLGTRSSRNSDGSRPRILGIFTGQGAQWPRMGAELISNSAAARKIIEGLDSQLARLPEQDRPSWTILEELQKDEASSQIGTAALSQPLCTAVQILLVDILKAAGIALAAVVGHSSGEIAAAYAAGRISSDDAICMAYYRGLSVSSTQNKGPSGAMMAVGTSQEDMEELLQEPEFFGRAWIAAVNSPASITVSGDSDAVAELSTVLIDERKFNRILKIDRAYHSPHMQPSSERYLKYQQCLNPQIKPSAQCTWISSVDSKDNAELGHGLKDTYWVRNLLNPVLFKQAVEKAWVECGPFDMAVEVGPHAALKGPALQTIQELTGQTIPYTGLLHRGANDLTSLADGLGYVSCNLGKGAVDFHSFEVFLSGRSNFAVCHDLPTYSWNHESEYWHESRYAKAITQRPDGVHELLGHLAPDCSHRDLRWRHLLRPKEVPWMKGHRLQGQIVFPAAGYAVSAIEACLAMLKGEPVSFIEVLDIEIGQALTFDDEETGVEVVFSLTNIRRQEKSHITATFNYSAAIGKHDDKLHSLAHGSVYVSLDTPSTTALPTPNTKPTNMLKVKAEDFYNSLSQLEYDYSGPFVALSDLQRKLGTVTGYVADVDETNLLVHPAMLDAAFQTVILAASAPDDGRLWSMHIPNRIRRVRVNPSLCAKLRQQGTPLALQAFQPKGTLSLTGDVDIFAQDSEYAMVQVEGLECVPFSPATVDDDRVMFSSTTWGPAYPDASTTIPSGSVTDGHYEIAYSLERAACFYLRKLEHDVAIDHPSRTEGPFVSLFKLASHISSLPGSGEWSFWKPEWNEDTMEIITALNPRAAATADANLLYAIGPRLADIVTNKTSAIEIGMQDDLLSQFYQKGLGMPEYLTSLARTIGQITHRSPRIDCLEIGAGTGAATKAIQAELGLPFSSYTFTDVSSGFFDTARASFGSDRMNFKVLDIERDPCAQGFKEHSYDLIVASMVLHATLSLAQTLKNVRRLLKPGGYLVVLEVQANPPARIGAMFGAFPGWWLGAEDGRVLSPCASLSQWNDVLHQTGFSGCDTTSPDIHPLVQPFTTFVTQAIDPRISFLREPLTAARPGTKQIQELIVLGEGNQGLSLDTLALLRPHCSSLTHVETLADLESLSPSQATTVLSLLDLTKPVFKDLASGTWESLKFMLQQVGCLVWVTQGRRAKHPHSNMTIGLLRSAVDEIPGLEFQFLDSEDPKSLGAETLATAVLRFKQATTWKREERYSDIAITIEPELVIEESGQVLVPRLTTEEEMNNRYNSSRRVITSSSPVDEGVTQVMESVSGYYVHHDITSMIKLKAVKGSSATKMQVSQSLLLPLRVHRGVRLYLSLGEKQGSSTHFLALSTTNSSVVSPEVLLPQTFDLQGSSPTAFLNLVASYIVISRILEDADEGDKILVHDPPVEFAGYLEAQAKKHGINVVFTTAQSKLPSESRKWHKVHPNSLGRDLKQLDLTLLTTFIDLGTTPESNRAAQTIDDMLPDACRRERISDLFGGAAKEPSRLKRSRIEFILREAEAWAQSLLPFHHECNLSVVQLGEIGSIEKTRAHRYVIDWTTNNQALIRLQPVDSQPLFRDDKTYWLVGLSGTLGLSLCEWMIRHGARHVAISSRNPQIEGQWLDEMSLLGGNVNISSCDVTKMGELQMTYEDICKTMPEVAGVAQGAMVLNDIRFSDTTFDILQKVTKPKVEGSLNLDALFQGVDLDFFVFFSSASSVIGTPGQSPYSAANTFMVSLAEQRRQRGLAASVINIGPVYGVGYVAEQRIDISAMLLMGVRPISETDFHYLFAEAVLACYSRSPKAVDITAGVIQVRQDEVALPKWASSPVMAHWVLNGKTVAHNATAKSKAPLKARLLVVTGRLEVEEIVEEALIEKLSGLLRLEIDSTNNHGFGATGLDELGIDSLMATEVRSWLMKNLQVNIPVLKILGGMTVKELVVAAVDAIDQAMVPKVQLISLDDTSPNTSTSLSDSSSQAENSDTDESSVEAETEHTIDGQTHVDAKRRHLIATESLSLTQSMFWLASTLFDNKASLNVTGTAKITGPLRVADLREAIRALGQRHECFRTSFFMADGKILQGIVEKSGLDLEHHFIDSEEEMEQWRQQLEDHVYDLENAETARAVLLTLNPTTHYFIVGTTHLCFDGFSVQVFLRDLFQHYTHQPELHAPLQYRDYAQTQHRNVLSGKLNKELDFWRAQYPDFPPVLPILRVSTATSRPSLASFNHVRGDVRVNNKTRLAIQSVSRKYAVTPFIFFLTCFRVFLTRWSDAEEVSIGIGDAHRNDDATASCIGVLVNVLPMRFLNDLTSKFNTVLQETKKATFAALENSNIPYQAILNELDPPRSAACTPIFQSFINYRQGIAREALEDCELELLSIEPSKTGYDLNLDIIDDQHDCWVRLFAREDIYGQTEVDVLVQSYEKLLETFAEEATSALGEPDIYSPVEVEKARSYGQGKYQRTLATTKLTLLGACPNSTWPDTVVHQIEEIATTMPNNVAVKNSEEGFTYSELWQLSEAVAVALASSGAVAGSYIALFQEPSPRWVASILAVLRIGGVYIPLDLSSPLPRLAAIVADSRPHLILTDNSSAEVFNGLEQPDIPCINVSCVEANKNASLPSIAATAESQAVLLYTSGSTGIPKGIILKHKGIVVQVESARDIYEIDAEVVLQQSASSFDLSYIQIFTALCHGGTLYSLPRHLRGDAPAIAELIVNEGITYTLATPTETSSWLRYGDTEHLRDSSWRTAICAGEIIAETLLSQLRSFEKPDLRFYNAYGPTELGVVSAIEVDYRASESLHKNGVPAGFPLPNCSVYVVDKQMKLCPPGVQGELYLGGIGVAEGYLNNSALTAERFMPDSFAVGEWKAKGMMHRVGDLGRWNNSGSVVIEGRVSGDTQIKLRGIRLDVQEIESAILVAANGQISEAVVTLRQSSPDATEFLVAHVVFDPSCLRDKQAETLEAIPPALSSLPRYMRPSLIIPLDYLPRTTSAKLDRKAIGSLPLPKTTSNGGEEDQEAELSPAEIKIRDLWLEVIQRLAFSERQITSETDFFHAGGTSLLLLELRQKINATYETNLALIHLMEFSTLGGMASLVDDSNAPSQRILDWTEETEPPSSILDQQHDVHVLPETSSTVVVTGSTGYLGRGIVDALVQDPNVKTIHCIGVRDIHSRVDMMGLDKVRLWEGDLKRPLLGLSEQDVHNIFSEADRIVHNGAEVSHLQSYHSLRLPNTLSTMELVKMSLSVGRRIPFHFVSTAQVGVYFAENTRKLALPEMTVSDHPPPTDGSDGYAAGKWASERFLERLDEQFTSGWPVFVHRPSLISRPLEDPASDLAHNVRHFAARLKASPMITHMHGYLNTVSLQDVVSGIVGSLSVNDATVSGVRYRHYFGEEKLPLDDPVTALFGPADGERRRNLGEIEELPPKEWAKRAGELGMPQAVVQWVETVDLQREQWFPELLR